MICPNCGKQLYKKLTHSKEISETQKYSYGICQYCKEIVNIVFDSNEDFSYGGVSSKETKYRSKISSLNKKEHVLFLSDNVENLFEICLKFNKKFGSNIGFIISDENNKEIDKIKKIYDIVSIEQSLFPIKPSFLAEKLIIETLYCKLHSKVKTISERFEVWND